MSEWLEDLTLETVIVHQTNGPSIKGLKSAVHSDCIVLREALLLEETGSTVLNGDIVILREQIWGMQLVAS